MTVRNPDQTCLPRVDQPDLLGAEEFTDPDNQERWRHFCQTNPELMRELLARAVFEAGNDPEVEKTIIDAVTWALGTLERAGQRTHITDEGLPPQTPAVISAQQSAS